MDGRGGELGQDGMVSFPRLLERATPRQAGIVRFLFRTGLRAPYRPGAWPPAPLRGYISPMIESPHEDVQRFHRWSLTYERSPGQAFLFDPVHRRVVDLVAAHLDGRGPAQVLDVGCGTGRLLRHAAVRWPSAELIGVDPAEGMIEKARSLTPVATFLHGRGEEIPLAESSAEVAFCTISFHHWADQAAGLREVARVLQPGGLFCLADGVIPSFAADLIPHTRVHTRDELRRLFWQAGFSVIAQKRILWGTVLATVGRKG
jgi:SAM-dependent methyltransferase